VGPLQGVAVVEFASLAPAPFGVMVLADLGAEVVRIDRTEGVGAPAAPPDPLGRNRRSIGVDLKHPEGVEVALRLVERADVAVEGWRPGVAERLGVGPEACLSRNPRLVYGRMTGWGQDGPLAGEAGHDIDYLAVAGALEPIGRAGGPPVPPLNLVADFGGGGMLLAVGILAALLERERSGRGQVVDAAMVEGAALLTTMLHGFRAAGLWEGERGANLLDSGAPFYDVYETADGRYVAVGAIEPQFFAALLEGLGIDPAGVPAQHDRSGWPALRERLAASFRTRTRDEWSGHFAGSDACVAPVLDPGEAPAHPHLRARRSFVEVGGVAVPGPAPRFGRTPTGRPRPAPGPGEHTDEILGEAGYDAEAIQSLRTRGAVA
jgi:alpha-methylacyl-CoA racemase